MRIRGFLFLGSFFFLFCGFFQITVGAYFLRENYTKTNAKDAKREKSRKLGEKRERGFAFEAPDTFRMVVFSDFERMFLFRVFRRVFASFIFSRFCREARSDSRREQDESLLES